MEKTKINISNQHQISWWDSLILATAYKAKATVLISEDLNSFPQSEHFKINPVLLSLKALYINLTFSALELLHFGHFVISHPFN